MPNRSPGVTKVLLLSGAPRSGSTVLAHLLGSLPGWVCAGEIGNLALSWSRGERCRCGQLLNECKFWASVVGDAFGSSAERDRYFRLEEQTLYRRHPGARALVRRASATAVEREVAIMHGRLVAAVARQSGASVVVDSTKKAPYIDQLVLTEQVALRVVHVVRDPRAVAGSVHHRYRPRSLLGQGQVGTKFALSWVINNLAVEKAAQRWGVSRTLVHHEEFTSNPGLVMAKIAGDWIDDTERASLAAGILPSEYRSHHAVRGSPSMRHQARVQVQPGLTRPVPALFRGMAWFARKMIGSRYGLL